MGDRHSDLRRSITTLYAELDAMQQEKDALDESVNSDCRKIAVIEDRAADPTDKATRGTLDRIHKRANATERRIASKTAEMAEIRSRIETKKGELEGTGGGSRSGLHIAPDDEPTAVDADTAHSHTGKLPWRNSPVGQLRGKALNVNERANTVPDAARQKVAQAIENDHDPESKLARYVIATGDPLYASAFRKWMRGAATGNPMAGVWEWTEQERQAYTYAQSEARAMSLGTTTAGGFLVSYELDPQVLISGTGNINPMRDISRVEVTSENVTKFVTSDGVTASWDAEAAEVSDDTPVLAQPSITCHKGQAFVPVSFEIFEDSPDLGAQIQKLFVDAKAQLEATAFTTGSGSAQPKGVITAVAADAGSIVDDAAGTAVEVADLIANQNALPARWRPNAKWMLNLSILNAVRQIPKGSGLTESIVDDSTTPPRILGWEARENSQMDGTIAAGTTNDYVLLSGDFQQFIIADRIGTTVEFVQNLFGDNNRPTGQRGFLLHWRTGSDAVVTDAFRLTNYSG